MWPETNLGQTVTISCPCGDLSLGVGHPSAQRQCTGSFTSGAQWSTANDSSCNFTISTQQLCNALEVSALISHYYECELYQCLDTQHGQCTARISTADRWWKTTKLHGTATSTHSPWDNSDRCCHQWFCQLCRTVCWLLLFIPTCSWELCFSIFLNKQQRLKHHFWLRHRKEEMSQQGLSSY